MRQPGIIGLHGLTTSNALHYGYLASGDDSTRRMLFLQNCAFVPMFRQAAIGRGRVADLSRRPRNRWTPKSSDGEVVAEIFADVTRDRMAAAGKGPQRI